MIGPFTYRGSPARIIFRNGARNSIPQVMQSARKKLAILVCTPSRETDARALADNVGADIVAIIAEAEAHTPVEVTERVLPEVEASRADCVISFGGGTAVGLAKAIAARTGLFQIAIPTTYSGSEATDVLGETENGAKKTSRSARVLPNVILYDPELTLGLSVETSMTSGFNAMAHALEALYAENRNPVTSLLALDALHALSTSLPWIRQAPTDTDARSTALYGAWLAGTVLGSVNMGLHHKLCHTLGGSFETPHAPTHAILLPHTVAFNSVAVPELFEPANSILGGPAAERLFDLAQKLDIPVSLQALGITEAGLDRAAKLATVDTYPNPRPADEKSIRAILQNAWEGKRPA